MIQSVRFIKRFHLHPVMGALMVVRGRWHFGFHADRRGGYRICTTTEIGPFVLDFDIEEA